MYIAAYDRYPVVGKISTSSIKQMEMNRVRVARALIKTVALVYSLHSERSTQLCEALYRERVVVESSRHVGEGRFLSIMSASHWVRDVVEDAQKKTAAPIYGGEIRLSSPHSLNGC